MLLSQCIVIVESGSVGIIWVVGLGGMLVAVSAGDVPACVGSVLVVKWYVSLSQSVPSVRLMLQ